HVAAWTCEREDGASGVPIGRPVSRTRLYVLDERFNPVLPGASGELFVGGRGLARGYLGRADQTAERFVPSPFAAEPGERLYRQGDSGRHGLDGAIEFIGRVDHQVKISGFRIEPGEIEAAICAHPAVDRSVVVARARRHQQQLVAYVTARPASRASLAADL